VTNLAIVVPDDGSNVGSNAATKDGPNGRRATTAPESVDPVGGGKTARDRGGDMAPKTVKSILCATLGGYVTPIDARGRDSRKWLPPGGPLHYLAVADGRMSRGEPRLCGLAMSNVGVYLALGLRQNGQPVWDYPLPRGVYRTHVEPVAWGQVTGDGAGQWVIAGADGSIHVLAEDGRPIERFNYGATLTGLAVARIGGQAALIVASSEGLEALTVK
jgi:hypothetical protein